MWTLLSTIALISCAELHELSEVVHDYPYLSAVEKARIIRNMRDLGPKYCPHVKAPDGVAPDFSE